jgi:hypothetical protein
VKRKTKERTIHVLETKLWKYMMIESISKVNRRVALEENKLTCEIDMRMVL